MADLITHLPHLPLRQPTAHKGDFGRILVIAGSRGMSGAAVLCGSAALRGGAGLVRVATPLDVWPIVAAGNPCYTTLPLPPDADGRIGAAALPELSSAAQGSDAIALGPGLGRGVELSNLVADFLAQVSVPIVLDADGCNAFIGWPDGLGQHAGPVVITPHPGEFARLLGTDTAQVQAAREELAADYARRQRLVVLLKGHRTVVTDGARVYVNETGNAGMATAGSGDVLTGLIAALIGQGLTPFEAAQLGAHLHGLAGDLARTDLGEESLTALDLVDHLPRAFLTWRQTVSRRPVA